MKSRHDDNQSFPAEDAETTNHQEQSDLQTRRDFIKKYGALAAITPVAMTLTLHNKKALASSCTECGP